VAEVEEKKKADKVVHPRPDWHLLFKTEEGRILLLGIVITIVGIVSIGVTAFWSLQASRIMGAMSFFNIFFGTIVSMSIGYAAGYGHAIVIPVNIWIEMVMVLLFYPLFVLSMRKLVEFTILKRFLERTQAAAERHHDKVRRYGIAGLFLFVWFPFWMTGPLVGCVIGYLLGFPAWLTITVVLAGTVVAMFGWAYLLSDLYKHAAVFGPWASIALIALLMLAIFSVYLLDRREGRRKQKLPN